MHESPLTDPVCCQSSTRGKTADTLGPAWRPAGAPSPHRKATSAPGSLATVAHVCRRLPTTEVVQVAEVDGDRSSTEKARPKAERTRENCVSVSHGGGATPTPLTNSPTQVRSS